MDGQGNFGSVDGDPPAAMRYTEARLTPVCDGYAGQIDQEYGGFHTPTLMILWRNLSCCHLQFPTCWLMAATGIAVGMATNIPPHNLGEVVDALIFMLDDWDKLDDIRIYDLMKFIKGPDFPTGGIIL